MVGSTSIKNRGEHEIFADFLRTAVDKHGYHLSQYEQLSSQRYQFDQKTSILKSKFVVGTSGVARGGQWGGRPPPAETLPTSCPPNEITLCTEVYGESPFRVTVSPPAHP